MKFINKLNEIQKEKKFKFICFFWIIIAIQFVVGARLQITGFIANTIQKVLIDIINIILISIIFISLHYCILELFNKIDKKEENIKEYKYIKYRWPIYFLIIIICWIPTLFAFYPCIMAYDGPHQISGYFFFRKISHHPILITKLYTAFYIIGTNLGDATIGMFLFSILQMTFMAIVFSYTVKFIEDETQKRWLRNISIIFYGLFPYNQLFPMTTTKDVIFAGLFVVFIICLYKMVKEKYKIADYIFFIIIGVLMLFSRNNAIYTMKVSLPFIILILLKDKYKLIKVVSMFLLIIIIYQITNNQLYKLEDKNNELYKTENTNNIYVVQKANNDEGNMRISVFTQAIGKVVADQEKKLTDEEKEKISYYFNNYKKLSEKYLPNLADSTIRLTGKNVNENRKEFIKFALELGKKYPLTYIESFMNTIRGYWYIEDTSFSQITYYNHPGALELYHFKIGKEKYEVTEDSKLPKLKQWYKNMFCENEYRNIPVLYMIFQPAIYFYATLAFLLYSIYKKEKNRLVIAIVLFTFFASLYLAYCSIVRYMYPIIVSMPIILFLTIKKDGEGKEEKK